VANGNTHFPNPVEHAAALIEVCGSLDAAREVAAFNWEFAQTAKDFLYWIHVENALTPVGEAN
jgi:hypothetical protein